MHLKISSLQELQPIVKRLTPRFYDVDFSFYIELEKDDFDKGVTYMYEDIYDDLFDIENKIIENKLDSILFGIFESNRYRYFFNKKLKLAIDNLRIQYNIVNGDKGGTFYEILPHNINYGIEFLKMKSIVYNKHHDIYHIESDGREIISEKLFKIVQEKGIVIVNKVINNSKE